MTRPRTLIPVLVLLAISGWAAACGDGATVPPPPDPPRATTLAVTPETAGLSVLDETVRLATEVRDQNGQAGPVRASGRHLQGWLSGIRRLQVVFCESGGASNVYLTQAVQSPKTDVPFEPARHDRVDLDGLGIEVQASNWPGGGLVGTGSADAPRHAPPLAGLQVNRLSRRAVPSVASALAG